MEPEAVVRAVWELFEQRRFEQAGELLAADVVLDWPQVGHRFRSREHVIAMNRAHPAPNWHIAVSRLVASGEAVAAEVVVADDEATHVCTGFYEVRDGLVQRGVEYWTPVAPQPVPEWRAAWTAPIPPGEGVQPPRSDASS